MSTIVKGYEVHEKLGSGAFGDVYRATSPAPLNAEVAIKVINQKYASQPDFIRRFESEATMVANLQCPYITPITNYWRDPDGAYIVMWYIRGGNLKESLKDGPFDVHRASRVLNQISAALSYAHRNGVIHRDVKPANILLDEEGNAYLSDFGIAKNLQQSGGHTNTGEFVGTVGYTAPEQIRGDSVSAATDIYSLGVILYEMLAGEHPFPDLNQVEQIYKSLNDPLPLLDGLDESIQDSINIIIQNATEKDPMKRYQDAIEMASAFREAIASITETPPQTIVESLTMREQEILKLIVERKSNREIATALFITVGTVKWYINQIYKKLNVRNRVEAIVKARELNLIVDEPLTEDDNGRTVHTYVFLEEPDNPYKGLSAFTLADERDFYGRKAITQKLLNSMRQETAYHRFLTIIGPSGSGKSSLVKAGLVPAVLRGELEGSEHWFVTDMIPGSHPLDELEIALMRVAADQASSIGEQIRRDDRGLIRASQLILPDDGSELLIVIDQFEEVFTLVEDEYARQQFLDLIYTAITDPRSRVRIVATLRADFYDRPLQYPGIGDLIRERMETILPLSAEELEQAIIKPAANVGVRYEEGVVARIISDVNYQPGALPLLQFALTELFENRHNRTITSQAYQEIGGTIGALAKRADELYLSLNEDGQSAARQLFLRLVTLGEGTEDTRRRTTCEELLSVSNDSDLMDDVIDIFASYRLLALDHDPVTHLPTVEVAHEAILREWEMLRSWLNDSREDIKQERQLAILTAEWESNGRGTDCLVGGTRLEQLQIWSDETSLSLTPSETAFLETSIAERDRRQAQEKERVDREANLQLRVRRVLQGLVAVFLIAAVVSVVLAYEAERQRGIAQDNEVEALRQASIGLAALAERELEGDDRELGVLLALEAVEHYPRTPQATGALALAIEQYRAFRTLEAVGAQQGIIFVAEWSPDGERVAGGASSLVIWDVETGDELLAVNSHEQLCGSTSYRIYDLVWSPSSDHLALVAQYVNSEEICGLVVLDTVNGDVLLSVDDFTSNSRSVDWSPDGTRLLTGHEDGTARLWDAETGTELGTLAGHDNLVREAVFSPDGSQIATASDDGTVRVWNAVSGAEIRLIRTDNGPVRSVAWSPQDDSLLVTGGDDGLPRVWNVETGETIVTMSGHTGPVFIVTWSSDGQRIASQSVDGTVKVWDAATGGQLFEIPNATPEPNIKRGYVDYSPDGEWILVGGSRVLGIRLWDTSVSVPILFGHTFGQEWGAWAPDGTYIATSGTDGSARLWDASSGEQIREFARGSYWSDWAPDGTRLVFGEGEAPPALNVWDINAADGPALRLTAKDDEFGPHMFVTIDWSPNGKFITAPDLRPGTPQALYIWDAETAELTSTLRTDDTCMLGWPQWSPDSEKIATGCIFMPPDADTPARIWDAETGEVLLTLPSEHGWSYRAVWSPDGTRLLVTYEDGTVIIYNATTGEPIRTFAEQQGGGGTDSKWSPDGTLIASADYASQFVKIWDSRTGEELLSFSVDGAPLTISWSPDGTHVIITGDGLTEPVIKRIWTSTDELVEHAYECCVTRELTPDERVQFGLPPHD